MTENTARSLHFLPSGLPAPPDDGAADHLVGSHLPPIALRATSGRDVVLASLPLVVVYVYPRTGTPGVALPDGWDDIPGARGCTVQNCVFRDHAKELSELGAAVHGLSAQPVEEQVAFAERERMPYPLLNDAGLVLSRELGLPTFEAGGMRLYRRLTFVAREGVVEWLRYPVFPPGSDAGAVLEWVSRGPRTRTAGSGRPPAPGS
ncbi:MAG: peroxiredoxin [Solirubrobacterales bacterium]